MAETLLSPGVLARENDQSFLTAQPVQAGAAIIGPTVKGPTVPTVVTTYSEYQNKFGNTNAFDTMIAHIDTMSRDIGIMEIFSLNRVKYLA